MKTGYEVELQFYKSEYFDLMKDYHLPEDQARFTALPADALEVTHEKQPVVIISNGIVVGFFVLHTSSRVKEYTDNPHAVLLTAFSVNHSHQGKGYAGRGLEQLTAFARKEFPECNEIVLSVNKLNIPAQKVYEKVGYRDTGRRRSGTMGEQFIYSFLLE
ncbi:GNAT family N-acetyltransferase [Heyndrickxia vini]|uniref:GNAT family N-acetyltransferase n=1 Tax=Heyndrickxia vini TaxID=1476025 RepID=A0ABX7E2V0_9BACI|nr:GNAT family N-acetyltransferase [Heyndrickxia vini]QQZ09906.1 GNAT family N-acetyltransferase [Heyndrickxia vini]